MSGSGSRGPVVVFEITSCKAFRKTFSYFWKSFSSARRNHAPTPRISMPLPSCRRNSSRTASTFSGGYFFAISRAKPAEMSAPANVRTFSRIFSHDCFSAGLQLSCPVPVIETVGKAKAALLFLAVLLAGSFFGSRPYFYMCGLSYQAQSGHERYSGHWF